MAGLVGGLEVAERERGALVESRPRELEPVPQGGGRVVALGGMDEPHADGGRHSGEEGRARDQDSLEAVSLAKRGGLPRAAPPLERDRGQGRPAAPPTGGVRRVARESPQRRAAPELGGAGRRLGLGHQGPGAEDGVAVAEERVRVGDAVVGSTGDHEDALSPLRDEWAQLQLESADRAPGDAPDEGPGVVGVVGAGLAGRPEGSVAELSGAEGGVGEHLALGRGVAVAAGLEDGAARELRRRVSEDGPVRHLARRRAAGAQRQEQAGGAARGEGVQVGGAGGLVRGAPAVRGVRPGRRGRQGAGRGASAWSAGSASMNPATAGGTRRRQSPPARMAARTCSPETALPSGASSTSVRYPPRPEAVELGVPPGGEEADEVDGVRRDVVVPELGLGDRERDDPDPRTPASSAAAAIMRQALGVGEGIRLRQVPPGIVGLRPHRSAVRVGDADEELRAAFGRGLQVREMAVVEGLEASVDHAERDWRLARHRRQPRMWAPQGAMLWFRRKRLSGS